MCIKIHIMNKSLQNIGIQIKNTRLQNSISQSQLANKCNVERSQLSKIEQGQVEGVTFATIIKILESLDLNFVVKKNSEIDNFYAIRPFVKWAGGKTQLLPIIEQYIPKQYNKYYEPFVGGGALLFKIQPKSFYINDLNEELINAYKCFCTKKDFETLKQLLVEHEKNHSESYFYSVRNMDRDGSINKMSDVERAARTIYINKACFNGLYRVNSKGIFNVPSGKKKTVNTFDRTSFDNLFKFFNSRDTHITSIDFAKAVASASSGDFIYFDPPYDTLNENTFTTYIADGFGKDEQRRLAETYRDLDARGCKVMLSNHDTPFIRELYKGYKIVNVEAKRMINSNGSKRGNVKEVLIMNY